MEMRRDPNFSLGAEADRSTRVRFSALPPLTPLFSLEVLEWTPPSNFFSMLKRRRQTSQSDTSGTFYSRDLTSNAAEEDFSLTHGTWMAFREVSCVGDSLFIQTVVPVNTSDSDGRGDNLQRFSTSLTSYLTVESNTGSRHPSQQSTRPLMELARPQLLSATAEGQALKMESKRQHQARELPLQDIVSCRRYFFATPVLLSFRENGKRAAEAEEVARNGGRPDAAQPANRRHFFFSPSRNAEARRPHPLWRYELYGAIGLVLHLRSGASLFLVFSSPPNAAMVEELLGRFAAGHGVGLGVRMHAGQRLGNGVDSHHHHMEEPSSSMTVPEWHVLPPVFWTGPQLTSPMATGDSSASGVVPLPSTPKLATFAPAHHIGPLKKPPAFGFLYCRPCAATSKPRRYYFIPSSHESRPFIIHLSRSRTCFWHRIRYQLGEVRRCIALDLRHTTVTVCANSDGHLGALCIKGRVESFSQLQDVEPLGGAEAAAESDGGAVESPHHAVQLRMGRRVVFEAMAKSQLETDEWLSWFAARGATVPALSKPLLTAEEQNAPSSFAHPAARGSRAEVVPLDTNSLSMDGLVTRCFAPLVSEVSAFQEQNSSFTSGVPELPLKDGGRSVAPSAETAMGMGNPSDESKTERCHLPDPRADGSDAASPLQAASQELLCDVSVVCENGWPHPSSEKGSSPSLSVPGTAAPPHRQAMQSPSPVDLQLEASEPMLVNSNSLIGVRRKTRAFLHDTSSSSSQSSSPSTLSQPLPPPAPSSHISAISPLQVEAIGAEQSLAATKEPCGTEAEQIISATARMTESRSEHAKTLAEPMAVASPAKDGLKQPTGQLQQAGTSIDVDSATPKRGTAASPHHASPSPVPLPTSPPAARALRIPPTSSTAPRKSVANASWMSSSADRATIPSVAEARGTPFIRGAEATNAGWNSPAKAVAHDADKWSDAVLLKSFRATPLRLQSEPQPYPFLSPERPSSNGASAVLNVLPASHCPPSRDALAIGHTTPVPALHSKPRGPANSKDMSLESFLEDHGRMDAKGLLFMPQYPPRLTSATVPALAMTAVPIEPSADATPLPPSVRQESGAFRPPVAASPPQRSDDARKMAILESSSTLGEAGDRLTTNGSLNFARRALGESGQTARRKALFRASLYITKEETDLL